jgi:hypothetical protein
VSEIEVRAILQFRERVPDDAPRTLDAPQWREWRDEVAARVAIQAPQIAEKMNCAIHHRDGITDETVHHPEVEVGRWLRIDYIIKVGG